MERIHSSNDTFLTGDEIAEAVFAYSEALAKRASCASVSIPVRKTDGSIHQARLLLGPASELASQPEETDFDELVDNDLVALIRHKTELLSATPGGCVHRACLDQETYLDPGYEWDL